MSKRRDAQFDAKATRVLRALGYGGYEDYRTSEACRKLRDRILADRPSCRICDLPASEVHIASYAEPVLAGKDRQPLHPLCKDCYDTVTFRANGRMRPIREATALMKARRTLRRNELEAFQRGQLEEHPMMPNGRAW
jgi:hypothetical protein